MRIHTTPDGIRYTLHHERPYRPGAETALEPIRQNVTPKGGRSVVTIIDKHDTPVITAEAICHPKLDNFSYKRGHQIALGRALKALRTTEMAAA